MVSQSSALRKSLHGVKEQCRLAVERQGCGMDDEFVHCLKDGPRCRALGLFPAKAAAWNNFPWAELSASRAKQELPQG